ncbi:hypothetical protein L195_g063494, partial [Trifolium pratense]
DLKVVVEVMVDAVVEEEMRQGGEMKV